MLAFHSGTSGGEPVLRDARPADVDALLAIEASSFDLWRMSRRSFARHIAAGRNVVRLAEVTGRIAGSYLLFLRRGSSQARLYSIAVDAAFRGRGISRLLMDDADRAARSHGCDRISLEVATTNARALALYDECDFAVVEQLPSYYGDGLDAVRMMKLLGSADRGAAETVPNSFSDRRT